MESKATRQPKVRSTATVVKLWWIERTYGETLLSAAAFTEQGATNGCLKGTTCLVLKASRPLKESIKHGVLY